jgi:hypothetical protein
MIAEHETIMVQACLIPWNSSVRTRKGEGVGIHRHVRINAALWSLDIAWGGKNERTFTDIRFRFRGIGIVRSAIRAMAIHYLQEEEEVGAM